MIADRFSLARRIGEQPWPSSRAGRNSVTPERYPGPLAGQKRARSSDEIGISREPFSHGSRKDGRLDALSGKQIWKSVIEYPPDTTRVVCCGIVNRGAAMFDGKLFRGIWIAADSDGRK